MNVRTIFGFLPPVLKYSGDPLSIEEMPLGERSVLLLSGGIRDAGSVLKIGDSVKSGQALSSNNMAVGFSPVTGVVKEIRELNWVGGVFTAFEIETAGDHWDLPLSGEDDFLSMDSGRLFSALRETGFELDAEDVDTVIVNCFENDLLLSGAAAVLKESAENIRMGVSLLKKITGARIIVAVPANIKEPGSFSADAEVSVVKPVYPNGMGQMLSRLLSGDGVSDMVIGVEYLNAMVSALKSGRPFIEKVVTLVDRGGKVLKNVRVRVGTPVSDILRHYNISSLEEGERVILGGPMRGVSIYDTDFPVTSDTDGILIQGASETDNISGLACLNCGKCVKVCPYSLPVNLIARYSEFSLFEKCGELDIDFCIECGLCAYECTSRRPLVQYIQFAKRQLEQMKIEEEEGEEQ